MKSFILAASLALFLAGCTGGEKSATTTESPNNSPVRSAKPDEQVPIGVLKDAYDNAKKAYEAKSADSVAKGAFAEAASQYAYAVMSGDGVPREKYPLALQIADEALAADPSNDLAKTTKMTIEAVYRDMGKAPPKPTNK